MLNIDKSLLQDSPFPHLIQRGLFEPNLYKALKATYPEFNRAAGWNRMSKDLMKGDVDFAQAVSQEPWQEFHSYLNSSAFLNTMVDLFQGSFHRDGLTVDPFSLKMTDYVETREWIATNKVSEAIKAFQGNKEDVFVRMDFGIGEIGYKRPPHTDWRHRICSLLVYFDDPEELKMDGGRFIINTRENQEYPTASIVEPENNMGIFKLDSNTSYHSVDEVTAINGERKTLYIAISSRGQVWPALNL